jgi:hypothetical protein
MRLYDRLLTAIDEVRNPRIHTHLVQAENHLRKDRIQEAWIHIEDAYAQASFLEKSDLSALHEMAREFLVRRP